MQKSNTKIQNGMFLNIGRNHALRKNICDNLRQITLDKMSHRRDRSISPRKSPPMKPTRNTLRTPKNTRQTKRNTTRGSPQQTISSAPSSPSPNSSAYCRLPIICDRRAIDGLPRGSPSRMMKIRRTRVNKLVML